MSSKNITILIVLLGCFCASILFVVLKKTTTIAPEPPHAETLKVYSEVPRDIELCFDSLLAWQFGDTNQFQRIIHDDEYVANLRDAVRRSIKQGRYSEVSRFINLVLNHWMMTEACHSRNYEWPDREADQMAWGFLSRIYDNRQQYPCSSGDAGVDATLKRILDKTSGK